MYNNNPTRVLTGEVRLYYVNLVAPRANVNDPNDTPKYSVTLLIPKTDTAVKANIDASIEATAKEAQSKLWGGVRPPVMPIALIRYFCTPCSPTKTNGDRTRNLPKHDRDKWDLFKEYCKGDVVAEMEIERRLAPFPVPITDLENPNSVPQLVKWLESKIDEDINNLRKDTVAQMLDSVTGDAEKVLRIRQELGKTSTKKYDAIKASMCADNRVRGLLQFYGANRTDRWSGRLV